MHSDWRPNMAHWPSRWNNKLRPRVVQQFVTANINHWLVKILFRFPFVAVSIGLYVKKEVCLLMIIFYSSMSLRLNSVVAGCYWCDLQCSSGFDVHGKERARSTLQWPEDLCVWTNRSVIFMWSRVWETSGFATKHDFFCIIRIVTGSDLLWGWWHSRGWSHGSS